LKAVDSARQAAKPAIDRRSSGDSVPPAHHHLGVAERDQPRGVADRMCPGGAGGDHGVIGPLEAVGDRHIAGGEVDETPREKNGDTRPGRVPSAPGRSLPNAADAPMPEPIITPMTISSS